MGKGALHLEHRPKPRGDRILDSGNLGLLLGSRIDLVSLAK